MTDVPVTIVEGSDSEWKQGNAAPKPAVPILWGWTMMAVLLVTQCYWVDQYTEHSKALKWGDMPIWVSYLILQLICIAYSFFACTYVFPMFPTIMGLPFFLLGFGPAFLMCVWPFLTDFGEEFAYNAPLWVLIFWSAVRLQFESIVQLHGAYGVGGVSSWLRWPIQTAPEPYTMTYPFVGWKVTRTRGGNVDAFSSLVVGMPIALITGLVDDDSSTGIKVLNWIGQIWIFVYLCFLGPVPHFLMGMPGPKNIFDGKGSPKKATEMYALTSHTLGTCCFWIASYAVIHFIVFVRKMGEF